MSKFNRVFAAGVLLAGLPMAAMAQRAVNVNVQVTVQGNCSVSAPTQRQISVPSTPTSVDCDHCRRLVTLTCNRGAAPLVAVSNGVQS